MVLLFLKGNYVNRYYDKLNPRKMDKTYNDVDFA